MKHTKGPWEIEKGAPLFYLKEGESCYFYKRIVTPDSIIADVIGQDEEGKDWLDRDEANVRLIAAAPELLEALKASAERWDIWADYYAQTDSWDEDDEKAYNLIHDAISKAEGRE